MGVLRTFAPSRLRLDLFVILFARFVHVGSFVLYLLNYIVIDLFRFALGCASSLTRDAAPADVGKSKKLAPRKPSFHSVERLENF